MIGRAEFRRAWIAGLDRVLEDGELDAVLAEADAAYERLLEPLPPAVAESSAVEAACVVMHDAYEAAALEAGWATQERSRVPWAEVPEANKATMRAAVTALLVHLAELQAHRVPDPS